MTTTNNSIIMADCVELKELNHIFIDLEYIANQNKNVSVYRSRSFNQKNKKHLQYDEIKDALLRLDKSKLKYIYLVGKNAMSHPEFNHILRMCLSICSVTIYTDGSCINDKKSRFLKRVEEEGSNEIIFKIGVSHYDEKLNDEVLGRGSFRKALHAVTSLSKYDFNPILVIKANPDRFLDMKEGFVELGKKFKFETEDINLAYFPQYNEELLEQVEQQNDVDFDCMYSRTYSKTGVYNCPLLTNDYRGRSGANLNDFSHKCYLESDKCSMCKVYGKKIYVNNWT